MAITRVIFLPESARLSPTIPPELNQDSQQRFYLAFDAANDEEVDWSFVAPQGMTGALSLVVFYRMATATSGAVRFEAWLEAITPGDTVNTLSASSFDATNNAGATVPATAGYVQTVTITLTNNDGIAAGDLVRLRMRRDANGTTGTDDAAGDAHVLAAELRTA